MEQERLCSPHQCALLNQALHAVAEWRGRCQLAQLPQALLREICVHESKGRSLLEACARDNSNWLMRGVAKAVSAAEFCEVVHCLLESVVMVHWVQDNIQPPSPGLIEETNNLEKYFVIVNSTLLQEAVAFDLGKLLKGRWGLLDDIPRGMIRSPDDEEVRIWKYLLQRLRHVERPADVYQFVSTRRLITYDQGKKLGRGTFGVVFKANWRGLDIAVKEFDYPGDLHTELHNLVSVTTHMNVIRIIGYQMIKKQQHLNGKKVIRPCLLMECMNNNLEEFINKTHEQRGRIPLATSVELLLQIARGMEYLHKRKITHGNLKPENVLLNRWPSRSCDSEGEAPFTVKITDHGFPCIRTHPPTFYMAPELWEEGFSMLNLLTGIFPKLVQITTQATEGIARPLLISAGKQVDAYSFGMLSFKILTGVSPNIHPKQAKQGKRPRLSVELLPGECPIALVYLMQKCWHTDPMKRPPFSQIRSCLLLLKSLVLGFPTRILEYRTHSHILQHMREDLERLSFHPDIFTALLGR